GFSMLSSAAANCDGRQVVAPPGRAGVARSSRKEQSMAFPSFPWRGGNFTLRVRPVSVVLPTDPFGRPASLMLGVLWIAVVWGIVLYLRHLAQAASDSPPDNSRQLFIGKWEPEDRSWAVEFTDDGQFRAYWHEVETASGTWQFVGPRAVNAVGT